jgi:hypothetical protein
MIQIKIDNSQLNLSDEWIKDETGWMNLDSLVRPIREAGFRGTGEITVDEIKRRIEARINIGERSGEFRYRPLIEHDQTQNAFRFCILWRSIEASPKDASI